MGRYCPCGQIPDRCLFRQCPFIYVILSHQRARPIIPRINSSSNSFPLVLILLWYYKFIIFNFFLFFFFYNPTRAFVYSMDIFPDFHVEQSLLPSKYATFLHSYSLAIILLRSYKFIIFNFFFFFFYNPTRAFVYSMDIFPDFLVEQALLPSKYATFIHSYSLVIILWDNTNLSFSTSFSSSSSSSSTVKKNNYWMGRGGKKGNKNKLILTKIFPSVHETWNLIALILYGHLSRLPCRASSSS